MRIAVSAWSFHKPLYAGRLRQPDVPAEVAALGFRHVELLEMFLWRKPPGILLRALRRVRRGVTLRAMTPPTVDYSRDTLNELRGARLRAGTQLACWAIDTDLTFADAGARRAQFSHMATAIEAARFLGAPMLRITTGGREGESDAVGRVIDALRVVLPVAMASGIKLAIENHFGLSADPDALVEIVAALNSPTIGVCLDLGNFREGVADKGIKLLAPHAIHVHAKSQAFNSDGQESKINYRMALELLRTTGYDGALAIEFEGDGNPADGIRKTEALIQKCWND
jgi:L-ribulose-5-phosphate 3-epimerase